MEFEIFSCEYTKEFARQATAKIAELKEKGYIVVDVTAQVNPHNYWLGIIKYTTKGNCNIVTTE